MHGGLTSCNVIDLYLRWRERNLRWRERAELATEVDLDQGVARIVGQTGAMSATGLRVFDATLQKTNRWLNELMQLLEWSDKERAYLALRATLHALRDRLTVEEAAQLSAQLPMLVRGLYFEGWDPTGKPNKVRHEEEFLTRIARAFPDEAVVDATQVARAVFAVLAIHVSEGEIEDVRQILPRGLRHLWPVHAYRGS